MAKTEDRVRFFKDICDLIVELKGLGIDFMPTCFYRSPEDQKTLYNLGKSKTLNSAHQDWLAIDFVLVKNGKLIWNEDPGYQKAGEIWESMGHTWGGRWPSLNDIYHFEF